MPSLLRLFFKTSKTTEKEQNKALIVSQQLNKIILESLDFEDVVQKIADSIPNKLAFATGVVAIIEEQRKTIRRVAASRTDEAIAAITAIHTPFKQIEISLNDPDNYMSKAIREHKILITSNSYDVLGPVLDREQAATIQKIMGTKTTFVCPIYGSKNKPIGIFIASTKKEEKKISQYEKDMIQIFTDGVGIAIEHALLFSKLKVTTEQLANANEKLKELDKLKDDFVSVASHELRTPMTAIKSYLWVALNQHYKELSPDMQRYLNRAYISVERLINMVNDMLNISRIEGGRIALRLAETDLVPLSREVYDEVLEKANEKNIDVVIVQKNVPKVLCDKDKIHEVLLNLIGNSLKFTKAGGTISVNFTAHDPYITISVTDTGVGISSENLSKLFTKFGRLENSYVAIAESGGTGLGLFISKSLVELHKGTIKATSPGIGKGTVFSFTLPIVGSQVAQDLAKSAPRETDATKELEKTKLYLN